MKAKGERRRLQDAARGKTSKAKNDAWLVVEGDNLVVQKVTGENSGDKSKDKNDAIGVRAGAKLLGFKKAVQSVLTTVGKRDM